MLSQFNAENSMSNLPESVGRSGEIDSKIETLSRLNNILEVLRNPDRPGFEESQAPHRELLDIVSAIYPEIDFSGLESLTPTTVELIMEERKAELFSFIEKYDSTGALNPEVFHSRMGQVVNVSGLALDPETGNVSLSGDAGELLSNNRLLSVSIDNLSLVNSEGGHQSGDFALTEAVNIIKGQFDSAGIYEGSYEIYHTRGSDFVVIFHGSEDLADVKNGINSSRLTAIEHTGSPFNVGLTCTEVTGEDVLRVINLTQDNLPEGQKIVLGENSASDRKIITNVLTAVIETGREYGILRSLLDRTSELSNAGKVDDATRYYNTYVKRFFQTTEISSFDGFKDRMGDESSIDGVLFNVVSRKTSGDWAVNANADEVIRSIVAAELTRTNLVLSTEKKDEGAVTVDMPSVDFKKFYTENYPKSAKIIKNIGTLHTGFQSYGKYLEKLLGTSFEEGALDISQNIIDYTRFYSHVLDHFPQHKPKIEENLDVLRETAEAEIPVKEKLFRLMLVNRGALGEMEGILSGRDPLTGLLKREQFYRDTYDLVSNSIIAGTDISICFGDLGFLKYTNDYGGRRSGDAELLAVANVLTGVAGKEDVLSRYAGDEFALAFRGSPQQTIELMGRINNAIHGDGEGTPSLIVPGYPETQREGFLPHKILFDTGVVSMSEARTTLSALMNYSEPETGAKLFNPSDEAMLRSVQEKIQNGNTQNITPDELSFYSKIITRLMVRQADFEADYIKGFNKVNALLDLYVLSKTLPSEEERNRVEDVLRIRWAYSIKSFGDKDISVLGDVLHEMEEKGETQMSLETYRRFFSSETDGEEYSMSGSMVGRVITEYMKGRR